MSDKPAPPSFTAGRVVITHAMRARRERSMGLFAGLMAGLLPRRYVMLLVVPLLLLVGGTLGYVLIQGWSVFDALYMTVITVTTVGYGEIPETLSPRGRLFTMVLLLGGVYTIFWVATELIRLVVNGEINDALGILQMENEMAELEDHLIVCGYGRMGRLVCREFSQRGLPFVIIDRDLELLQEFDLPHGIPLHGDVTSDEVLRKAGVLKARALVAVTGSDADNLYVTMSARLLNDRLFIVARAESEQAESKLERAGANKVVSPYVIGGNRVAQAILRPTVLDFIDVATKTEHFALQIEETLLADGSPLEGVTLQASQIRQNFGIFVVAIKKRSGEMVYNPPGDTVLEAGDTLVVLGPRERLDELDRQAGG